MAWSATSAPADVKEQQGVLVKLPIVSGETVYKGDIVRINGNGYATSTGSPAAGDMFAGIALETVDNSGGGKSVLVRTEGVYDFTKASATQTDVGTLCYLGDNQQTVVLTESQPTVLVGAVVGIVNSSTVRVKIISGLDIASAG